MNRRVLAVAAATVIALFGAVMVLVYARNADSRAVAGQEARAVYVTTAVVPAGTSLRDALNLGLLEQTAVAAKAYPVGALSKVDGTNQDSVALADVGPGQYALAAAFGEEKLGTKAITVPPGQLAIAVSLADPAKVGNFVTPGSHITIFQTYKLVKFGSDEATKQFNQLNIKGTSVLLNDVQVIGMGNTTNSSPIQPAAATDGTQAAQPQSPGANFLVTLAVSPADSVKLVHAINAPYTLYAGLLGEGTKVPAALAIDDRGYNTGSK
jgi:pilus assembly protein CpaB